MFSEERFREVLRQEMDKVLHAKIQEIRDLPRPKPSMMTRHQVMQELGIGLSTVDYWVRTGRLTKIRIGKRAVRFKRSDVEALMAKRSAKK